MDASDQVAIQAADVQQQRETVMKIALEALSHRILTLMALFLNAGMGVYCMIYPDALRAVAALLFAGISWCLINVRMHKGD